MTQPQGPQPDPQSNQQPNMGPNPNLGTPPPQIMYVQAPKRPWYQRPGCLIPLILVILVVLGMASCTAMMAKPFPKWIRASTRKRPSCTV